VLGSAKYDLSGFYETAGGVKVGFYFLIHCVFVFALVLVAFISGFYPHSE
jgi:hypothetical protein